MSKAATSGRPTRRSRFTFEQVEAALEKAHGMRSHAAKILEQMTGRSCSHVTIKNYIDKHPRIKAKYDEIVHSWDDKIETTFLTRALSGQNDSLLLHLVRTRLAYRGYGDKPPIREGQDAVTALRDMLERSGEAIDRAPPGKPNGSAAPDTPHDGGEIA